MVEVLSGPDNQYVNRSRYWMQLQPYLELFDHGNIEVITQEELQGDRDGTMRKACWTPSFGRAAARRSIAI